MSNKNQRHVPTSRKRLKLTIIFVIIVLCALGLAFYLQRTNRPAESAQQQACDRAAKQAQSPEARFEGESIDAAICQGISLPATPAQSQ